MRSKVRKSIRHSWRVLYRGKPRSAFPRASVANTYLLETAEKKIGGEREGGEFHPRGQISLEIKCSPDVLSWDEMSGGHSGQGDISDPYKYRYHKLRITMPHGTKIRWWNSVINSHFMDERRVPENLCN